MEYPSFYKRPHKACASGNFELISYEIYHTKNKSNADTHTHTHTHPTHTYTFADTHKHC